MDPLVTTGNYETMPKIRNILQLNFRILLTQEESIRGDPWQGQTGYGEQEVDEMIYRWLLLPLRLIEHAIRRAKTLEDQF